MQNKDIVIIALVVLTIYLYYQQTQSKSLNIQPDNQVIQELKQQINHYQTLYQKRVEKDLEVDQNQKIEELTKSNRQLTENFQNFKTVAENEKTELVNQHQQTQEFLTNKITDLETSLLNLAKQKIKGKKEAERLLNELEKNWQSDKEQKERTIINLNQSYEKLENQHQKEKDNLSQELTETKQKANQELTELKATHQKELELYQTKLEQLTLKSEQKDQQISEAQAEITKKDNRNAQLHKLFQGTANIFNKQHNYVDKLKEQLKLEQQEKGISQEKAQHLEEDIKRLDGEKQELAQRIKELEVGESESKKIRDKELEETKKVQQQKEQTITQLTEKLSQVQEDYDKRIEQLESEQKENEKVLEQLGQEFKELSEELEK